MAQIMQMANSIKNGNPEMIYQQMYANNPRFRQFVDDNKGLNAQEIAKKYNIPL